MSSIPVYNYDIYYVHNIYMYLSITMVTYVYCKIEYIYVHAVYR